MNRLDAIAQGLLTYPSPKPCRKGHNGERYSSNGMCVQCLKERGATQANARKMQRLVRNNRKAEKLSEVQIYVKMAHAIILNQLLDIINSGDADQLGSLQLFTANLHKTLRRPGAWSLADIIAAGVETDGQGILNLDRWEYDDRQRICIHGHWFDGFLFMAVLRGKLQWITPEN